MFACTASICPDIVAANGSTVFTATTGGTTATGTCAPGYAPNGIASPTQTCYANATWSGVVSNACVRTLERWPAPA